LPQPGRDANFVIVKERRDNRNTMKVGDRILIKRGPSKDVFILARVEIPHSMEKVFATRSGGGFSIGLKVWRSDYVWSAKSRMWVPKN
jgi:hypothetical protein